MKAKALGGTFQGTAYGQCYGQYMYTYYLYITYIYVYMHNLLYIYVCMHSRFSHAWLFATLQTVAYQDSLSMGFSRLEH